MKKIGLNHIIIIALLTVLPAAGMVTESSFANSTDRIAILLKWFVFFAVGLRLILAGIWQTAKPSFTAEKIFEIQDKKAQDIVRELGFANLTFGILGILSLPFSGFRHAAALAGALYLVLAGIQHIFQKNKNANEWFALASDFFVVAAIVALEVVVWMFGI